jgi:hypothetical protein
MFTSKTLLTLITLSGSASTGIAMAAFNCDNKSSGGEIGWSVFWELLMKKCLFEFLYI